MTNVSVAKGTVVVVDDDQDTCDLLATALRKEGHAVTTFSRPEAALHHVATELVDAIVSDVSMSGMDGVELCERARRAQPDVPVVLITGQGSLDTAIRALRAEAFDFVLKPVDLGELRSRLQRAIELSSIRREIARLHREATSGAPMESFAGNSPPMRQVYDLVRRVAGSDASVLIRGETGTGKELVARAIHKQSGRRDGPFVAINCAAVPENLIESQLFGHTRGAFTDAKENRAGLFIEASGGTLFLEKPGPPPAEDVTWGEDATHTFGGR